MAYFRCNNPSSIQYDFYISNFECPNEEDNSYYYLIPDTGKIMKSNYAQNDFEILVNYTNKQTDNSERGLFGISYWADNSGAYPVMEFCFVGSDKRLQLYTRRLRGLSGKDEQYSFIGESRLDDKDIIIRKIGENISVICENQTIFSQDYIPTAYYPDSLNRNIRVGLYKGTIDYKFVGSINKFGFRWL